MRASVVGRGYDGPLYGGLPLGGGAITGMLFVSR